MERTKKINLGLTIGFECLALVNLILLIVLDVTKVFKTSMFSYFMAAFFFVVVPLPVIIQKITKIKLSLVVIVFYQIFVVLSLVIGSLWGIYKISFYYDKFTHLVSGILIALVAYNFYVESKSANLSSIWLFVLVFSIALAVGGFWEICEFSFDAVFPFQNTQKWFGLSGRDALMDTMLDIVSDFAGSVIGGIIATIHHHKKHTSLSLPQPEKNS